MAKKYKFDEFFIDYLMGPHTNPMTHLTENYGKYGIKEFSTYVIKQTSGWKKKKKKFLADAEKMLVIQMRDEAIKRLKPIREDLWKKHNAVMNLITIRLNQELERTSVKLDKNKNPKSAQRLVDYKCIAELWRILRVELGMPTSYSRIQEDGTEAISEVSPEVMEQIEQSQIYRNNLIKAAGKMYDSGRYKKPKNVGFDNGALTYGEEKKEEK